MCHRAIVSRGDKERLSPRELTDPEMTRTGPRTPRRGKSMECDFPRTRKRRADKKRVRVRVAGSLEDGNTEGDPYAVIPGGFKRQYAGRIESVRRKNLPVPF